MEISAILEKAPAAIASYTVAENNAYATMILAGMEYKRLWAKTYLEKKSAGGKTIPELECELAIDPALMAIKDKELAAEIDYRASRQKKENARDHFNAAQELGRTRRAEMKSLGDSV